MYFAAPDRAVQDSFTTSAPSALAVGLGPAAASASPAIEAPVIRTATAASATQARRMRDIRAVGGEGSFPSSSCNAPWVSAVVETDLSVRPCFFHPAYGRIGEGGLAAVLNGEAALLFRRSLDVASDPVCLRCPCRLNLRHGEGGPT